MRLYAVSLHVHLLRFKDGSQVLFSYDTPVAGFSSKHGYFKTKTKYSVTTSKHISQYLQGQQAMEVEQDWIDSLAG